MLTSVDPPAPLHVSSQVDVHQDVIGGHFNNSKFLTGDGGLLQALVHGYGGLRIVDSGLKVWHAVKHLSLVLGTRCTLHGTAQYRWGGVRMTV